MKEILACRKIFPCQIQTDSNFPLLATALISQLNMLVFAYSPFFFSDFHGNGVLGFWLWVIGLEPRIWIWWENHRLHQGLQACFWSGSVFFFFLINILFTYRNFHRFSSPITGFFGSVLQPALITEVRLNCQLEPALWKSMKELYA